MTENRRAAIMNDGRPIGCEPPEIWFQPWCDECENDSYVDGGREMDTVNSWPEGCTRAGHGECSSKAVKYILDSSGGGSNHDASD